jgi:hypothetical protein
MDIDVKSYLLRPNLNLPTRCLLRLNHLGGFHGSSTPCAELTSIMDSPMGHWFQRMMHASVEVQDARCAAKPLGKTLDSGR